MSDQPGDTVPGSNLTLRTLRGVRWTYLSTAAAAVMQTVFAAVMGRLLEPAAFGLMAMALLALSFGSYFARMGVGQALIQKPDLTERETRAGFTSSVALGAVFAGVIWFAAPLAVLLFNEPAMVPILQATGLTLLLRGAGITAESLLRREMRFGALARIDVTSYGVGYLIVGLSLAYLGFGVWSLVGAALTESLLGTVLAYRKSRHPTRPVFEWDAFRGLYAFGSRVSLISFLEFLGNNLDTLAVGRFAGTVLLGHYNRAFLLLNLPLRYLTTSLSKVLFPSFSLIQADTARLRRGYIGAVSLAAAVLLPISAGMGVAAPEIVRVVLGPGWDPVAAILPILAVAASFKVISHFAGVVCEARAELNKKLALQGAYLVILAVFLLLASGRGLWAYAAALAAGEAVRHAGYILLMARILDIRLARLSRVYGPGGGCGGVVALAIAGGRWTLLAAGAPPLAVLAVEVATGAVTLLVLSRTGPLRGVRRELTDRLQRAGILPGSTNLLWRTARRLLGVR